MSGCKDFYEADEEPEVGREYLVRTIDEKWCAKGILPVLGHSHDDAQYGFGHRTHFHPDLRFLEEEDYAKLAGRIAELSRWETEMREAQFNVVSAQTFCAAAGAGDELTPQAFADATEVLWDPRRVGLVTLGPHDLVFWRMYGHAISLRPMICLRRMPKYLYSPNSPVKVLEKHFAGCKLRERCCPHKGTELGSMPRSCLPDGRTCVTCPAHGLNWDMKTGEMIHRGEA